MKTHREAFLSQTAEILCGSQGTSYVMPSLRTVPQNGPWTWTWPCAQPQTQDIYAESNCLVCVLGYSHNAASRGSESAKRLWVRILGSGKTWCKEIVWRRTCGGPSHLHSAPCERHSLPFRGGERQLGHLQGETIQQFQPLNLPTTYVYFIEQSWVLLSSGSV